MKPFNLAEARILERNYCQQHISKRLTIMALMILLTLLIAGGSFVCKSMFAGQVQQTKSRLADAQGRRVRLRGEMTAINMKLSERKWHNQLAGESNRWLGVMDSALGCVPPDVWLDSVKSSPKESSLSIAGRAASFDAVTSLIGALRSRKPFGEVRLESARMDSAEGATIIDFTLVVTLKGGASVSSTDSAGSASVPETAAPAPTEPTREPAAAEPPVVRGQVPDVQGST